MRIRLKAQVLVCAVVCTILPAQTRLNLSTQAKSADLSSMGPTKPAQTGSVLPATCSVGEVFFLTSAPPGTNLNVCAIPNQWSVPSSSSGGPVSIEVDGTVVGASNMLDLLSTSGSIVTANQAGNNLAIGISPQTSLFATRANVQSGSDSYCVPSSGSPVAYTCALPYVLSAYTDGMTLTWRPDVSCTGGTTTTIQVGALTAINVYQNDGVSNPLASQCAAGSQVLLIYGGGLNSATGGWRILSGGSSGSDSGSSSSAVTSTLNLPVGGYSSGGAGPYPAWNISNANAHGAYFGGGTLGLELSNVGTPSVNATFIWPSNWDNTTPVNVIVGVATGGDDTNNFKLNVALACITTSQPSFSGLSYGAEASLTVGNSPNFRSLMFSNVSTNSCTAGSLAGIVIARDNTITSNAPYMFPIVGVAIQWTSH